MTTEPTRPALRRAHPVLASLDIEATLRFYEERLGFTAVARYPDHGIVERDGVRLHFWRTEDPAIPRVTSCRLDVVGVDALHDEMQAAGVVHPKAALTDRPWGIREFTVVDGDGNLLHLGEPLGT